jgi:hypothetical protein
VLLFDENKRSRIEVRSKWISEANGLISIDSIVS